MLNSPFISIGITCFNARNTILRAIEGASQQDYSNFEIIIVDDCSVDGSADLVAKKIEDMPKARLVRHDKNKGFPAALNTLLHEAKGEYIAFFDDDDISVLDRLSAQLKRIQEYAAMSGTNQILCYSNRNIYLPDQIEPDHVALAIGREAPEPYGESVADFILWHSHDRRAVWGLFGSCTLMAGTQFLKDIGGFDESFRRSAEWDMAIRAACRGAHFIAVDRPLIAQHKTLTADKAGQIPLRYALQLRKKHRDFLRAKGVYLSALCLTYYQHYAGKKHVLRAKFWMALACILSPRKIFWEKLSYSLSRKENGKHAAKAGVFSKSAQEGAQ